MTAASGSTTQLENGCFSPESRHSLRKFYSKLMSPHVNLPRIICQIVYQFSDIVGVYHMPFQQLKIFCLCQNSEFLLIYDMIQNQTSNLWNESYHYIKNVFNPKSSPMTNSQQG